MKSLAGILPWAVVLLAAAGAISWLLSARMAAGPWLLALLLIGHGFVHAMFAIPAPVASDGGPEWPFGMASSWLASRFGLDAAVVRAAGFTGIAIVAAGFVLAALSTVGIAAPSDWWRPAVAVSALTSATLLLLFFNPQLVLGLAIDATLLGVVVTRAWAP